jgi:hypothetical protein
MRATLRGIVAGAVMAIGALVPTAASADPPKRIGAHVGFVLPLVSHSDGRTTTIADDFVFGLPAGVALKQFGRFVLDMEVVTGIQNAPRDISLELHPGVVMSVTPNLAAGVRAAFDVEGDSWGVTPLINRTLYVAKSHSLFGEVVVPIRFVDAPNGTTNSVGFAVHVGVGF